MGRSCFVDYNTTDFKGHLVNCRKIKMTRKQLEKAGRNALMQVRKNKFRMGFPFMINTNDLPSKQFYLEYADGHIKLAVIKEDKLDYKILAELTIMESDKIRKNIKLSK